MNKKDKKFNYIFGSEIVNDVKKRLPYYKSDWIDACHYRVLPACLNIYFSKYVRFKYTFITIDILSCFF